MPKTDGVPLRVIRLGVQAAVIPAGNPEAVPKLVAPVTAWVIFVSTSLIQPLGVTDGKLTVLFGDTIIVPVAFILSHPPVNGMI